MRTEHMYQTDIGLAGSNKRMQQDHEKLPQEMHIRERQCQVTAVCIIHRYGGGAKYGEQDSAWHRATS